MKEQAASACLHARRAFKLSQRCVEDHSHRWGASRHLPPSDSNACRGHAIEEEAVERELEARLMSKKVSINEAAAQLDELSEEERRALRRSRFHAEQLHARHSSSSHESKSRLAHPGGALATNKAAALAKFLKRKLNEPGGAAALDPDLVERAVENAKATAIAGQQPAASSKAARIRHVDSFSDSDEEEILQRELHAEQHHRAKSQTKKKKVLDSRIEHISKKKNKEKKKKKTKKS